MSAADTLNVVLGSTVLAAAVREAWRWYTARTAKADESAAAASAAKVKAHADANAKLLDVLERNARDGEARAEKSAERAVALTSAMRDVADGNKAVADALERGERAIAELTDVHRSLTARVAAVEAQLAALRDEVATLKRGSVAP